MKDYISDIICSRAWYCDDCETYHKEDLWIHGDGTYTTGDSDGDHEPIEAEDVDQYILQAEGSWIDYAKWVAETGKDPCENYYVDYFTKVQENWIVFFTDWIGREKHGYAVYAASHDGKEYQAKDFTKALADFLCLKKVGDRYCMEDITMEDIRTETLVEGSGPSYSIKIGIEYNKPRHPASVAADIRKAARKHLASHK